MKFSVATEPWVPTSEGFLSIQEALGRPLQLAAGSPLEHVAITRFLMVVQARAGGDVAGYLQRHADGLDLFSPARPFLQVPHHLTASLAPQPIAIIHLARAAGSTQTVLSHDLDHLPRPLSPAQAVVQLLTYQQYVSSNGKSAWGHTYDTPLARAAAHLVEGDTLAETLALNTPELSHTPVWEAAPDWQLWTDHKAKPGVVLNPTTLLAFPWLSVTLEPAAQVTQMRLAGGPRALPGAPDPHTLGFLLDPAKPEGEKNPLMVAKNPSQRAAEELLTRALHLTLTRADEDRADLRLPLGFQRAREQGARQARLVVASTRTGQPVIQDVLEAVLPWPTIPAAAAATLLEQALGGHARLGVAARRVYFPLLGGKKATELGNTSGILRQYWQRLWPALALALIGEDPEQPWADEVQQAAEQALGDATSLLGAQTAFQVGRGFALQALRQGGGAHDG